ncbi:MAG: TIGR02301 family protein, partial [Pseudomonadota bacterium]
MTRPPPRHYGFRCALATAALVALVGATAANARERPYDRQLFRLAETLGAVHYLRELCVGE